MEKTRPTILLETPSCNLIDLLILLRLYQILLPIKSSYSGHLGPSVVHFQLPCIFKIELTDYGFFVFLSFGRFKMSIMILTIF